MRNHTNVRELRKHAKALLNGPDVVTIGNGYRVRAFLVPVSAVCESWWRLPTDFEKKAVKLLRRAIRQDAR